MSVVFITRHGKRQQQNHCALQQGSPKLLAKWHLTEISWANNNIMRCHVFVYTCRLALQCLVRIWSATPIIFNEVLSFSGEKFGWYIDWTRKSSLRIFSNSSFTNQFYNLTLCNMIQGKRR